MLRRNTVQPDRLSIGAHLGVHSATFGVAINATTLQAKDLDDEVVGDLYVFIDENRSYPLKVGHAINILRNPAERLPLLRQSSDRGDGLSVQSRRGRLGRRAAARIPKGAILGARVEHLIAKEALLADDPQVYFTIPHFDGYPAVLVRLDAISLEELKELVVEAWLCRAPKRLAGQYIRAHLQRP